MSERRCSRRWALGATATAIATAVGAGPVGATQTGGQDSQSISLSNGNYEVELDARNSTGSWRYDTVNTLYQELYVLETGDGTQLAGSRDGTLAQGYPSTGQAGQRYDARVELSRDGASFTLQRGVRLAANQPRFTVFYEIRNDADRAIDSLSLYQYVDYDIAGSTGDAGEYDQASGLVSQRDDAGGRTVVTGFRGSRSPAAWDVGGFGSVGARVTDGSLSNSTAHQGDVTTALRYDVGPVAPGGTTSLAIGFAAADSAQELQSLLATVSDPAAQQQSSTESNGSSDSPLPGFGVGAAAAGVAGAAYGLARRRADDGE